MSGIWHGAWYADSTQQMISDDEDDDNVSSPVCKGATNTPLGASQVAQW